MELSIKTTIEHIPYPNAQAIDWPVEILYEYDGGIQVNAVFQDNDEAGEDDVYDTLTDWQKGQVEQACIDDYADRCDAAQAHAEDMAAARAEAAMEARREELDMRKRQRGYRL